MPSAVPAGRPRFSFKASHRRVSLRVSHRTGEPDAKRVAPPNERERYIAPPKRRR